MKSAGWIKYLLYFFSFLPFYPSIGTITVLIELIVGNITSNDLTRDILFYSFTIIAGILGAFGLNFFFKEFAGLEKNNKCSWIILLSHIVLYTSFILWIYPIW